MKKNISSLLITLFIASTLLIAAKPLAEKTKPAHKSKDTQLNKVKPIKEKVAATNIVKPMKKKPRKPSEVQDQLKLLKEKFEDPAVPLSEKSDIIEFFKEFNEIFYGDIDIDSFFRQLMDLSRKWDNG